MAAMMLAKLSSIKTMSKLPAHVRAGPSHGNANVRLPQRRGVVYAVARHGHDVLFRLQGPDNAHLGRR